MSAQDEPDKLKSARQEAERSPDGSTQGFEAELASLSPRAVRLDRDRLMFLAGQASVSSGVGTSARPGWAWPTAFSAMSAMAAGLLLTLVLRSQPHEIVKIVYVPSSVPSPEAAAVVLGSRAGNAPATAETPDGAGTEERGSLPVRPSDMTYVRLRDRVLATGVESWANDGLAAGDRNDSSRQTYHDLLEGLLHDG